MPRAQRIPFCHSCGVETEVKTTAGSDLCPGCLPVLEAEAVRLYGNKMALPRVLESLYARAAA